MLGAAVPKPDTTRTVASKMPTVTGRKTAWHVQPESNLKGEDEVMANPACL